MADAESIAKDVVARLQEQLRDDGLEIRIGDQVIHFPHEEALEIIAALQDEGEYVFGEDETPES